MSEDSTDENHTDGELEGPDGSLTNASGAEHRPGETDGPPQDCTFSQNDEVNEAFVIEPIPIVLSPVDNLPVQVDSAILALAPRFSEDNVVCIADEREFVEIFVEEMTGLPYGSFDVFVQDYVGDASDDPEPGSTYILDELSGIRVDGALVQRRIYGLGGSCTERLRFEPGRVKTMWGHRFVLLSPDEIASVRFVTTQPCYIPVRPVRPQCEHYKRQMFGNDEQPNPDAPGHRVLHRLCTVRRSNGGGFMGLRDEAVYACDMRSPRNKESEERFLDAPDRRRLTVLAENVPLFNIR